MSKKSLPIAGGLTHQSTSSTLVLLVGFALLFAACGSDETSDPNATLNDVGIEDTGIDDVGELDASDPDIGEPDTDSDPDTGPDTGEDTDVEIPDNAPVAMDDFLICGSDLDCPINGSRCVDWVSFNRTDADGEDEVPIWELFEELSAGDGVCTRDCSYDPTICDSVFWSDSAGVAHESTCLVVATGAPPYEITSQDPFEVEVDFNEMELGQAFGAICLPPFDRAADRSSSFCASCSHAEDCEESTRCYNALTEQLRESADELGDSFCVESCEDDTDCPMGFSCGDVDDDDGSGGYCLPIADTCTDCIDRDQDGYGTGHCGSSDSRQTPFDCDDTNPDAFFAPDEMSHPFPDHCYDDPDDEESYFYDLNCSGVLDHLEQIGTDEWGEFHCTECGDECSGETDGGFFVCKIDEDTNDPYCGVGCEPGFATCSGDPADGCPIDIAEEEDRGSDKPYRDHESPYIWYDAPDGEDWATSDAEPHFFCTEEEALTALDNPTQRRGCHPDEPGAHPEAEQLCDDIDWNCSGLTGPDDPETTDDVGDGQLVTVDASCDVPDSFGMCQPGVATCSANYEMSCEPSNDDYPVSTPYCSTQDSTCDGQPDTQWDGDFLVDDEDIVLVNADGDVIDSSPDSVSPGDLCQVPGLLGECRIGEVQCTSGGLVCQQTTFPQPEQPGFDGIDHSCDGFDRHMNNQGDPHVIYVDIGDSGPTLPEAIELADQCRSSLSIAGQQIPCDVFVQDSSLFVVDDTIELIEDVHVYGGFNISSWNPNDGTFSPPDYATGMPATEIRVENSVGLRGKDIGSTTHFKGISVRTADLDGIGCDTNIGAICQNCDGLILRSVDITAGAASDGASASEPTTGSYTPRAGDAGYHTWYGSTITYSGGNNGLSTYSWGGNSGRNQGETYNSAWVGQDGWGNDGRGGAGGASLASPHGQDGEHGIPSEPADLAPWTEFDVQTTASNPDINLTCPSSPILDVELDQIGAGGGGSFAWHEQARFGQSLVWMTLAAGGGSGGYPGVHGHSGFSGAASIGMILVDTDAVSGIEFHNVQIQGGAGGGGGDGSDADDAYSGAPGGQTTYSAMGSDYVWWEQTIYGGDGGDGAGGTGGNGGNGGPSIGLMRVNSPIGSAQPSFFAGSGGIGGQAGQPGDGGNADNMGYPGLSGAAGPTCAHYRVNATSFTYDDDHCLD